MTIFLCFLWSFDKCTIYRMYLWHIKKFLCKFGKNKCIFDNFGFINVSIFVSIPTKFCKLLSNLHPYKQLWQTSPVFLPVVETATFHLIEHRAVRNMFHSYFALKINYVKYNEILNCIGQGGRRHWNVNYNGTQSKSWFMVPN